METHSLSLTLVLCVLTVIGSSDIEYLEEENEINIDRLDEGDILDVVKNFIAERDPILELYLSLCFLHPQCYQLEVPLLQEDEEELPPPNLTSEPARQLWGHLEARRTESARNLLVGLIRQVQAGNKRMMFQYIKEGVAARGVSIAATRNIIDSIKNIWESVNKDLETAKSKVEELFYVTSVESESQKRNMVDLVGALLAIPSHTRRMYQEAAAEGYQQYVKTGSWNSWKWGETGKKKETEIAKEAKDSVVTERAKKAIDTVVTEANVAKDTVVTEANEVIDTVVTEKAKMANDSVVTEKAKEAIDSVYDLLEDTVVTEKATEATDTVLATEAEETEEA